MIDRQIGLEEADTGLTSPRDRDRGARLPEERCLPYSMISPSTRRPTRSRSRRAPTPTTTTGTGSTVTTAMGSSTSAPQWGITRSVASSTPPSASSKMEWSTRSSPQARCRWTDRRRSAPSASTCSNRCAPSGTSSNRMSHNIACDLTFRARTVAIEEPRQQRRSAEGILLTDHTRLTQLGTWEGTIDIDGDELCIESADVSGTRDRSWGIRPVGEQVPVMRQPTPFQVFWLWAPLHFGDRFTHLAFHEHEDGRRWLQTAQVLEPIPSDASPCCRAGVRECHDIGYELQWQPGRREIRTARLWFQDPIESETHIEVEKLFTFRMRYRLLASVLGHGANHGQLETGRESIRLDDFDPTDFASIHLQNVRATMGDRHGVGVVEQIALGPHRPIGLTGFLDGYSG